MARRSSDSHPREDRAGLASGPRGTGKGRTGECAVGSRACPRRVHPAPRQWARHITVDANVQYRISDARAWRYHCQNPAAALRAIAYRAVMISTVNRTLSEALSENVATLTGQMRARVQKDADALGLGVQVLAFTVGGMHPPVPVASDYEAVVSAELGKVTATVNAQAYRNQTVPIAEALVVVSENDARAEGTRFSPGRRARRGALRTLESQYRIAPEEFFFRRRLETLEKFINWLLFIFFILYI